MWDRFVSTAFRRLDEISGGRGRLWFVWVCGIHDCGKACPAFQAWTRWRRRRWRRGCHGGGCRRTDRSGGAMTRPEPCCW
ncbi:HD domain-containing protein [Streptomyces sp. NPDC003480]